MHHVRFDGQHVGLFATEGDAQEYISLHRSRNKDHAKRFAVEPIRRFALFCRGNFIDAFHARELADAHVEKNATEEAPAEVWEVVDTAKVPTVPPESVIEGHGGRHDTPVDLSPHVAKPEPAQDIEVTYTPQHKSSKPPRK
jgi:hypothetical protein